MNVAFVSTPRSGNSWLRCLLREHLGIPDVGANNLSELPSNPDGVIVQIHWPRTKELANYFRAHRFRVISMRRHPLDVLVSMLHFAQREPDTGRWLEGNFTAELDEATPLDARFFAFALGSGFGRLLHVTKAWERDAVGVTYEDLWADPLTTLRSTCEALDVELPEELPDGCSFAAARALPNQHGWVGEPGLHRKLVIPELGAAVYAANPSAFERYPWENYDLSIDEARARWEELR